MNRVESRHFRVTLLAALSVTVLLAVLVIPFPFAGDQALYSVFARMMNEGSTLYQDVWDVKQPGIFWFYSAVGAIGGFGEIAIHTAAALYWIAASVLVVLGIRPLVRRPWVAALFLVTGPAFYFAATTTDDLAEVEPLITPLIAGVVVLLALTVDRGLSRTIVMGAGLLAGIIGVFKLLALIIPITTLLVAIGLKRRKGDDIRTLVANTLLPFGIGALIPLLALGGWVILNDLVSEVRFTWIQYPPQMLAVQPRPLSRLLGSTLSFGVAFAGIGGLALYRVVNRDRHGRSLSVLTMAALAVSGLYIVLQLWWNVHFFVLVTPIAILAVQGIDDLFERSNTTRILAFAGSVILLIPTALAVVDKGVAFCNLVAGQTLAEFQFNIDARYESASRVASQTDIPPRTAVYVIGTPLILELLEADQSIPINGWSPEFWTLELWNRVIDDLERGTTEHVYIEDWVIDLASERAPGFMDRLFMSFHPVHESSDGTWLAATS